MKKIFIAAVILIFIAYCWSSSNYFATVEVPQYAAETIDLMNGMTPGAWANDPTGQKEWLRELSRKQYQPELSGINTEGGVALKPSHILTEQDFRKILESSPNLANKLQVRNPDNVYSVAGAGYTLRDDVYDKDGKVVLKAGSLLDKPAIDMLQDMGFQRVRITGTGPMVAPELGTMLMVALIFLALYCSLQIILFEPLIKIVDERDGTIQKGLQVAKDNRANKAKLMRDEREKRAELRAEHLKKLATARHEVMREADGILKKANVEAHRMRDNAAKDIRKTIDDAESQLRAEVDMLAQEIVSKIIGKEPDRG